MSIAIPTRTRWAVGFLSLAALPALILVAAATAHADGWRLTSRLDMAVVGAAAAVLTPAVLLGAVPRGRRWLGDRAGRLALLATSLTLALVTAEVALRLLV